VNGGPVSVYPLQICQGDCNSDWDCDWGLNCLQRDSTEEVPGCMGEGTSGNDYCYLAGKRTLHLMGVNGVPEWSYPLKPCEGACDYDYDCDWGHNCLHRNATEAVPECDGVGEYGVNYCYKAKREELQIHGIDGFPGHHYPLKECEGNCQSDNDCKDDLLCFIRSGAEEVPGCYGLGEPGFSYCYDPYPDDNDKKRSGKGGP
jgi:hypothetical protein